MDQRSKSSKFFANRLAGLVASDDGAELLRRLKLTGLIGANPAAHEGPRKMTEQAVSDLVGIWERKKDTSHFVRRLDKRNEWQYWARIGKIDPKGKARRVLLIGESVARGYLYDPQFNAARALTLILESHFGPQEIEVIDLARTNLGMASGSESVQELILSALLLEPDAVVVFAGNNWNARHWLNDLPYAEEALREEGLAALKRIAEVRFQERVSNLIHTVATAYRDKKVPLLWLVPEFNLRDWRDPGNNASHLPEGGNAEWLSLLESAQAFLQNGQINLALEKARRLIELDSETNSAGFYILAECYRILGDLEQERQNLEHARDASILWDTSMMRSPRRHAITQKTIIEEGKKAQIDVIDLAGIFKEYLPGALPDRRFFLDYCHMTIEGIHVAMAAASSWVVKTVAGIEVPWRQFLNVKIAPPKKVQAEAALLAAIHNGHWYQSYELVVHYCKETLKLAPELAKVMVLFIQMQNRHAPILLSKAGEKLSQMDYPSIKHYLLRNLQNHNIDRTVTDAMISALKMAGIPGHEHLERLRIQERGISQKPADLLDDYYCASSLHPQERKWNADHSVGMLRAYYKAYSPESKFLFVADAACVVQLDLVCRLQGVSPGTKPVYIYINGKAGAQLDAGSEWTKWQITVPADSIRPGINEIALRWPLPQINGKQALASMIDDILLDLVPELSGTFGEIYSFTAAQGVEDREEPIMKHEVTHSAEVGA